jgi:hypothetical protein
MARRAFLATLIAAAVSLVGVGAATAAPPEGSLHLRLVASGDEDIGPRTFAFTDTVYQGRRAIGTSRAVCRVSIDFTSVRCKVTLSLPAGKLFVSVGLTPDPQGSFRVTGGTGAYKGKTGIGIFKPGGNADTTKLTIWLTS